MPLATPGITYARARKDFEYLETIEELDDWVSLMDDLTEFMQKPNKKFAQGLYENAISLWFGEHGVEGHEQRVVSIAERYGKV